MKPKQFSERRDFGVLKEAEAGAVVTDLCRRHGLSRATYYAWKAKFGGLEVSDAKRLRALEEENGRLKRLLADPPCREICINRWSRAPILGAEGCGCGNKMSLRVVLNAGDDAR